MKPLFRLPSEYLPMPARLVGWCAILAALAWQPQPASAAAIDWNDAAIRWRPWTKALAEAKQNQKPICLVFYANWCRHCKNYGRVFHSQEVVEAARNFVMVRLNQDLNPRLSRKFAIDGDYIPRTYFLSPDGTPNYAIHASRDDFRYFYDEDDPESLLEGFRAARRQASAR